MKTEIHHAITSRATRIRRSTVAVAVALLFAATQIAVANTMRVGIPQEPRSLDLHNDTSTPTINVSQAIYDTLVRLDDDLNIVPWLATSWEQLDEVTWQVGLRDDVRFHSGGTLDAQSVKAHFDRTLDPDDPGLALAWLTGLREVAVIDDSTVEFRLDNPLGPFMFHLAMPHNAIVDVAQFEEIGEGEFGLRPSGTGPFRVDRWERGSAIHLAANDDYWAGALEVDGLEFRIIPEASSRIIALEAGEVDLIMNVPFNEVARLQGTAGLEAIVGFELRSIFWFMNLQDDVLSDVNVRRALAHAIDVQLIVDVILDGNGRWMRGFLPPETFGYAEVAYEFDTARAAELLEASGWARDASGFFARNGERLAFTHLTGGRTPLEIDATEAIQSMLRDFGVDMRINRIEGPSLTPTVAAFANLQGTNEKPDFQMSAWDAGIRTGDASIVLEPHFFVGGPRNASHFASEEFEALVLVGMSGAPESERLAAYQAAQQILFDQVPVIPLWQPAWAAASRDNVQGFSLHPTGLHFYERLTFE